VSDRCLLIVLANLFFSHDLFAPCALNDEFHRLSPFSGHKRATEISPSGSIPDILLGDSMLGGQSRDNEIAYLIHVIEIHAFGSDMPFNVYIDFDKKELHGLAEHHHITGLLLLLKRKHGPVLNRLQGILTNDYPSHRHLLSKTKRAPMTQSHERFRD